MKKCVKCGKTVEDSVKFCPECGGQEFEVPEAAVPAASPSVGAPSVTPAETADAPAKKNSGAVKIIIIAAAVVIAVLAAVLIIRGVTKGRDGKVDEIGSGVADVRDADAEDDNDSETTTKKQPAPGSMPKLDTGVTVEPAVLLDESGVKITLQELTFTGNEPKLTMLLENNTDKKLNFTSEYLEADLNSVNGYMLSSIDIDTDITPGNKSNETVRLDYDELLLYGITEIQAIDIGFTVYDESENVVVTKAPVRIKTSGFKSDDFSKDTFREVLKDESVLQLVGLTKEYYSEDVVYDDGGVTVDTVVLGTNKNGEKALMFEGYNSGSSPVILSVGDIELNDITVSRGRWTSIPVDGGKHGLDGIVLDRVISWGNAMITPEDIYRIGFKMDILDEEYDSVATEREVVIELDKAPKNAAGGKEVYNNNNVVISYMGVKDGPYGNGISFVFQVTNNNSYEIEIQTDTTSINGYMIDGFEFLYIDPGKTGSFNVDLNGSRLEENNITSDNLSSAEFTFKLSKGLDVIDKPTVTLQLGSEIQNQS